MIRRIILSVSLPARSARDPAFTEQFLTTVHQANPARHPVSLIITCRKADILLAIDTHESLIAVVQSQLYAAYPDARITPLSAVTTRPQTAYRRLHLEPDVLPCRRHTTFATLDRSLADPLGALLAAVASDGRGSESTIRLTLRPAHHACIERSIAVLPGFERTYAHRQTAVARWFLDAGRSPLPPLRFLAWRSLVLFPKRPAPHDVRADAEAKLHEPVFEAELLLTVSGPASAMPTAHRQLQNLAGAFGLFSAPGRAAFVSGPISRRRPRRRSFLLSAAEAATIWHAPVDGVSSPTLSVVASRELPPPTNLPMPTKIGAITLLGTTSYREQRRPFGILSDDLARHTYVVGKTGSGKTTLLQQPH